MATAPTAASRQLTSEGAATTTYNRAVQHHDGTQGWRADELGRSMMLCTLLQACRAPQRPLLQTLFAKQPLGQLAQEAPLLRLMGMHAAATFS
jgi:hypothetical protein